MSGDVRLRPAKPEDVAAVQRVARAAWHAAYDDVIGAERVDETVDAWYDPDRLLADDVEDPTRDFFVATIDESVVGFAEAVPDVETNEGTDEADENLAHLYRLYVDPDHWGDGVGTALLDRVESSLRERGVERLTLSVMAENDVGVSFYESRGFERVDTFHDDHLDIEEYEYRKSL